MSRIYTARIAEHQVAFTAGGATLSVMAYSDGAFSQATPIAKEYTGRIDEIVKQIAGEEGWSIGLIAPCEPVYVNSLKGPVKENEKVFYRQNYPAVSFITRELAPFAKSLETGEAGYQLYFEDSVDGTKVFFHPLNWDKEVTKQYKYVMGAKNTEVISFTPDFKGVVAALSGSGLMEAPSMDVFTNEIFSISKSKDNINRNTAGSRDIDTTKFRRVIGSSSYSMSEMEKIASDLWFSSANFSYPATLVIRGDVSIQPQEVISVVVLTPDGIRHHSTGLYLVVEITDTITGGEFLTELSLVRNALSVGVNESGGIDITDSNSPIITGTQFRQTHGLYNPTMTQGSTEIPVGIPESEITAAINPYIGIPYKWGGKTVQSGLDCSGFTHLVMKDLGIDIGHGTSNQQHKGTTIKYTGLDSLLPGDLLFYGTSESNISHVAIYVGNGKRAHAPQTGDVVKYDSYVTGSSNKPLVKVQRVR